MKLCCPKGCKAMCNLDRLRWQAREAKEKFVAEKATRDNLQKRLNMLVNEKQNYEEELDILEKARLLLAESSRYAKEEVKAQIEVLITSGLQYVFEKDIRFEIQLTDTKNRTEARFYNVTPKDGKDRYTRPEAARGGGILDVNSLILRVAMLQAVSPMIDGPLVLDEPVKMVSARFVEKVGEFLKQLNVTFGRQIIMATHDTYLSEIADKKFSVSQTDGVSNVEIV